MIDLRWTFLVVSSGNPASRSKRSCAPKTLSLPVPGGFCCPVPCSSTCCIRSRYCRIAAGFGIQSRRSEILIDFTRVRLLQYPVRNRVHGFSFLAEKTVGRHCFAGRRLRRRAGPPRKEGDTVGKTLRR